MPTLDQTFERTAASFPPALRAYAAGLPTRLGLLSSPEGNWEHVMQLAPGRSSPSYVAEVAGGGALAPEVIERYCEAHHCAAFFAMVAGALEEGQALPTEEMRLLRRLFLRAWGQALERASAGDTLFSRGFIAGALSTWRRAVRWRRLLAGAPQVSIEEYTVVTRGRLVLLGANATALLRRHAGPSDVALWRRIHQHFVVALQCIDDTVDAPDLERRGGASVPQQLGVNGNTLFRCAIHLVERARADARAGGFRQLADWLDELGGQLGAWVPVDQTPMDEWQSVILASRMQAALAT